MYHIEQPPRGPAANALIGAQTMYGAARNPMRHDKPT